MKFEFLIKLRYFLEIVINMKIIIFMGISMFLISCKKNTDLPLFIEGDGVFDIENNYYPSIILGNQEWMASNLKTRVYSNGDSINSFETLWVWYNNDPGMDSIYGKLYNYAVVEDTAKICPCGWHVPSENEFAVLINYLGGFQEAAVKLKARGTIQDGDGLWYEKDNGTSAVGNNTSGFTALPAGEGTIGNNFFYKDSITTFWANASIVTHDEAFRLHFDDEFVAQRKFFNTNPSNSANSFYFSIRCIKDY